MSDPSTSSGQAVDSLLRRGVAEVIVEEELRKLLAEGRPLRLKQGFDPSRPDIHLGHVVGLRKLAQFQKLGHQIVLIVGDWTAQIGDPSGASATRPMLTAQQVKANAQTYLEQFFKVVDPEKTELRWQSEWFGAFGLDKVISLTSKFTVAQMLQREDFARRYEAGRPIAVTELLYPLLQAYDSVMVRADVEFGGIDQKFNCLLGRELQGMVGQRPQQVLLVPLLVGTDGVQKMSKSLDNYVAVTDEPEDMYGKVMSLPDSLIVNYFELVTDVADWEVAEMRGQLAEGSVNPMALKQRLAREVVAQFHGAEAAREAEGHFERVFRRRELPDAMVELALSFGQPQNGPNGNLVVAPPSFGGVTGPHGRPTQPTLEIDMIGALVAASAASSRSEARRLLMQGAVDWDRDTLVGNAPRFFTLVHPGTTIKVGKRRYIRVVNADNKD